MNILESYGVYTCVCFVHSVIHIVVWTQRSWQLTFFPLISMVTFTSTTWRASSSIFASTMTNAGSYDNNCSIFTRVVYFIRVWGFILCWYYMRWKYISYVCMYLAQSSIRSLSYIVIERILACIIPHRHSSLSGISRIELKRSFLHTLMVDYRFEHVRSPPTYWHIFFYLINSLLSLWGTIINLYQLVGRFTYLLRFVHLIVCCRKFPW